MKLFKTKLNGPLIIKSKIFKDKRGYLRETFKQNLFKNLSFPFEIMSYSKKNVLRGLHIQTEAPQAKILTVTHGRIFDVSVDLRKKSKNFGKFFSIIISDKSNFSLFIPEGFAHGFLCLSQNCTVNYKCSKYRHSDSEKTLIWNDPKIKIKWPCAKPVISKKDKIGQNIDFFKNL